MSTTVTTFYAGTAIRVDVECKNKDGTLIDPSAAPSFVCYDPDGESHSTGTMTKDAVGKYHGIIQTLETDETGEYKVKVSAESGGYTSLVKPSLFYLKEGTGT